MKKTLRSLLMVAMLLSVAQMGAAKDKVPAVPAPEEQSAAPDDQSTRKPVIVVSIAGYDKVVDDVSFIGKLAQQDKLKETLEAIITLQTNGKGLAGLDKKRPWGVVLSTDGFSFSPLGFVPITNLKQFLDATAGILGPYEKKEDGTLQIEKLNQTLHLKENNGWLFIGQSPESLEDVPADPSKALGGLDKQYEVAVRLYVHNIPEFFRSMAIDQIKNLIESVPPPDDEEEAAADKRKEFQEQQTKSLTEFINTVDQFTLGWALDQSANTSSLDTTVTAISGSTLADKFNALKETTSNYTGFMLPKAAVVFNRSQTLLQDEIEQSVQGIDQLQPAIIRAIENSPDLSDDDSLAAAKRVVAEAADAIKATLKTGKIDSGGSLLLGDRRITLSVGAYISQPAGLEKAINDLVAVAKKDPNFPAKNFGAATDGDVRYVTWTSLVPADDRVNRAIGKELKLAIGFGPQSVYFGVGTDDPLPAIKKAIVASKAGAANKVPPGMVDVALQPILDFVTVLTPDDETIAAVQAEVAKTPGKDHVHFQLKPLKNGVSMRLEMQEGVLKALGLAAKMQMDKKGGGGP